jgi:ribosomal protein L11 methyltransferase
MPWLQIHVPAATADVDSVQQALEQLGAVAVTLSDQGDEPLLEPSPGTTPLWQQTVVTGLFSSDVDQQALTTGVRERLGPLADGMTREELADQQWERSWMDDFQPMRFGERLWIVPSWRDAPRADAVNLRLDPGLAFGTGTHETTALCLEWLDGAALNGKSVIDYGCGSGVLGIAAVLLGAGRVEACDIDTQALQATRDNARENGVDDRLHCCLPEALPGRADILLANILAAPLIDLAGDIASHVAPGGELVLSGILEDQAADVSAAYEPWFRMSPPRVRGDWVLLHGVGRQRP